MRRQSNCRYTSRPSAAVYTTPTVETSVAVATPSITAARITNGSVSPGIAMTNVRTISDTGARGPPPGSMWRGRDQPPTTSAPAATAAGNSPPVNSAVIDTLVTEPMVISTRLGGIVSDIALELASSAAS